MAAVPLLPGCFFGSNTLLEERKKMAYKITEDCISCGACESVCPNTAISQGADLYEIDAAKCTECKGFYDESQCSSVCPVDACIQA